MTSTHALKILLASALCCAARPAQAMENTSTWEASVDTQGGESRETLEIPAKRLVSHILSEPADDVRVNAEWDELVPRITAYLQDHVHIATDGVTCTPARAPALSRAQRGGRTWVIWRVERACALPIGEVSFVNTALTRSRHGYHHLGILSAHGQTRRVVFDTTHARERWGQALERERPKRSRAWLWVVGMLGLAGALAAYGVRRARQAQAEAGSSGSTPV